MQTPQPPGTWHFSREQRPLKSGAPHRDTEIIDFSDLAVLGGRSRRLAEGVSPGFDPATGKGLFLIV